MTYKEKGKAFCAEINALLKTLHIKAAFVTGGGYAYDSIKYQDPRNKGDYDFMIVYEDSSDLPKLLDLLKKSNFKFEDKYLDLDKNLLEEGKIDIIRLSGKYFDTKSTINLVPKRVLEDICNFKEDKVIKKVAHNRNTSLFFAYGSDNSRIITNFISPSFVTDDKEDHYIHLDFTHTKKNNNIYLGILADAILKGFNENYDTIQFKELREKFIDNIHKYFEENKIDSTCFINLFSNNNYFPEYLKEELLEEFNKRGEIKGKISKPKNLEPIVFTADFESNYKSNPFNFINNKPRKGKFLDYIKKMHTNEYDRQYLLDALGKFYGYLLTSKHGNQEYKGSILNKIEVYGTNDLYLPDYDKYTLESIIKAICYDLKRHKNDLNYELIRNYLMISMKFLEKVSNKPLKQVMKERRISKELFNSELDDQEMHIETIKRLKTFNEIGTYHNYTSKVMPKYTKKEAKYLSGLFPNKDGKVLDIMCGYGRLANELNYLGHRNVTGIDSEKYSFLGTPKDFIFIEDDFLKHNFKDQYDYAYSLYNCYPDIDELMKVITKSHSLLKDDGLLVTDYFNKEWRDSVEQAFTKVLYQDDDYRLIIKRDYNKKTGEEETYYELFYHNVLINVIPFIQKFFTKDEVLYNLGTKDWDYSQSNSGDLMTRTNEQKNIMILRKK